MHDKIESEQAMTETDAQTDQTTERLTTQDVASMLGLHIRVVQRQAERLGGTRPLNGRKYFYTRDGVVAGARALGLKLPKELDDAE